MFMSLVLSQGIIKTTGKLKNKASEVYDGIHPRIVKFVTELKAAPLSHILNPCIDQGVYLDKLKPVIVKPLHKKIETKDL